MVERTTEQLYLPERKGKKPSKFVPLRDIDPNSVSAGNRRKGNRMTPMALDIP